MPRAVVTPSSSTSTSSTTSTAAKSTSRTSNAGPSSSSSSEGFSIFVLGETGNGKSQFCQYLTGNEKVFHPSDGSDSFTQQVSNARASVEGYNITVFDTPGLNDKRVDADAQHIKEMVTKLRNIKDCKAFLIVLNVHQPRFSNSTKETIEYFRDIFGPSIVSNMAIIWAKATKRVAERWRKSKQEEFVAKISDLFGEVEGHIPSFYMNSVPEGDYEYDEEFHWGQVKELLCWANGNKVYDCSGARLVDTKKEELEKAEAAKKQAEEKAIQKEKEIQKANEEKREMEKKLERERQEAEARRIAKEEADRAAEKQRQDLQSKIDSLTTAVLLASASSNHSSPSSYYSSYPSPSYSYCPSPSYSSSSSSYSSPSYSSRSSSGGSGGGTKFYKGGQFIPGGGRAPKGGGYY